MRGMKKEIGKKKKQRLVLVIIIALIVAVISRFVVPVSLDRWKGFIFFALFIAISGIGVYFVSKQPDDDNRY